MKKPNFPFSKEKITDIATSIGSSTKNAISTVSKNVKESSEQINKHISKSIYENDKKRLCPIFAEDINSENFALPPMIRVVSYDKRMENKSCEGAIGFVTRGKDIKVLNVYNQFSDLLNIRFYPYLSDSIYYVDPCYDDLYITIEEYFSYLKKMRVDELSMLAQDLGATHVKIELKEQKTSNYTSNKNSNLSFKLNTNSSHNSKENKYSNIEVAAEINFSGKETPVEPKLIYFKNESDIQALVKMRLNPNTKNQILSKTYSLKYNNSSGIKVNDAAKIDTILKSLSYSGGVSVVKEAQNENNTILAYSISFE